MLLTSLVLYATSLFVAAPAQELHIPVQKDGGAPVREVCAKNLMLVARQKILSALPLGFRLLEVQLPKVCIPEAEGPLRAEVLLPQGPADGTRSLRVVYRGRKNRPYTLDGTLTLQATAAAKSAVVMARGADVKVVVSTGNVTVQAAAVAQESAGLGEAILVLPSGATRVVRGRVVDAKTVEVTL